jgi:hypothetical protein
VKQGFAAFAVALVAAVTLFGASDARGEELRETAARVADKWREAGATVSTAPPRFLNDDGTIAIPIPEGRAECVTIVLVGARGLSFHARIGGEPEADDRTARASSIAGALAIARCGGGAIKRLAVTSDAGRGVVETIVAYSGAPLPSLRAVLPERTGGVIPQSPEPGDLPPLPSQDKRADVADARARRDGGTVLPRVTWNTGADGAGSSTLTLTPGCHRIELFAVDPRTASAPRAPSRGGRIDLDAELRDADDGRLLARDRTDAPDAHLELCPGEEARVEIVFAGAPRDSSIMVAHATWAIPPMLPETWGNEARARMAHALLARRILAPREAPVMLAQGGAGTTPVAFALEPGACYVAAVAGVSGQTKGIGIRAQVGARESTDDRNPNEAAGAVTFCALERTRATLQVEARGTALVWGLALFRVASGVWEVAR